MEEPDITVGDPCDGGDGLGVGEVLRRSGEVRPLQILRAPLKICRVSIDGGGLPLSGGCIRGREQLRAWKPEDGREKWFCGACGSSLFSTSPDFGDPIGIRMGAFDTDPGIRPSARFFVASAAPWEPMPDDGLPRFAAKRRSPPVTVAQRTSWLRCHERGRGRTSRDVAVTVALLLQLGQENVAVT